MSFNMNDADLLRELELYVKKLESHEKEVDKNSTTSYYINELANILSKYENNKQ